jgi:hypothetical protein
MNTRCILLLALALVPSLGLADAGVPPTVDLTVFAGKHPKIRINVLSGPSETLFSNPVAAELVVRDYVLLVRHWLPGRDLELGEVDHDQWDAASRDTAAGDLTGVAVTVNPDLEVGAAHAFFPTLVCEGNFNLLHFHVDSYTASWVYSYRVTDRRTGAHATFHATDTRDYPTYGDCVKAYFQAAPR